MPRKDDYSKINHTGICFLYYQKILCSFFGQKMKNDLSPEKRRNMIFSVHMYKCYKYGINLLQ